MGFRVGRRVDGRGLGLGVILIVGSGVGRLVVFSLLIAVETLNGEGTASSEFDLRFTSSSLTSIIVVSTLKGVEVEVVPCTTTGSDLGADCTEEHGRQDRGSM